MQKQYRNRHTGYIATQLTGTMKDQYGVTEKDGTHLINKHKVDIEGNPLIWELVTDTPTANTQPTEPAFELVTDDGKRIIDPNQLLKHTSMGNKAKVLKVYPTAKAYHWGNSWEVAVEDKRGICRKKGLGQTAKKAWENAANKLVK